MVELKLIITLDARQHIHAEVTQEGGHCSARLLTAMAATGINALALAITQIVDRGVTVIAESRIDHGPGERN